MLGFGLAWDGWGALVGGGTFVSLDVDVPLPVSIGAVVGLEVSIPESSGVVRVVVFPPSSPPLLALSSVVFGGNGDV